LSRIRKAHNRKKDDNLIDDIPGNDGQQRTSLHLDSNKDHLDKPSGLGEPMQLSIHGQRGPANQSNASIRSKAEQYLQQYKDNSQWRFGLFFDYEYEEYPERGTRSLFEKKNSDCPILWIRIDPDGEYIRKIKV
jgi:hypothetical protein